MLGISEAMPGIKKVLWKPKYFSLDTTKQEEVADRIISFLEDYEGEKISFTALRRELDLTDDKLPDRTWTNSRALVDDGDLPSTWIKSGRSYERLFVGTA